MRRAGKPRSGSARVGELSLPTRPASHGKAAPEMTGGAIAEGSRLKQRARRGGHEACSSRGAERKGAHENPSDGEDNGLGRPRPHAFSAGGGPAVAALGGPVQSAAVSARESASPGRPRRRDPHVREVRHG